jgi:DNA-binding protein HU-beta
MNKAQLIEMLGMRLGMDRKVAAQAVDGMVDIIVRNVDKGENVTVTGFGVFEKRVRAARTARNPRTGESIRLRKTAVPNFRPGAAFKEVVDGTRKLPRVGAAPATAARPTATAKPAAKRAATTRAVTVTKAAPKKAQKLSAQKVSAQKVSTPKASDPKKTAARTAAKVTPKATRPATRKAAAAKKSTVKATKKRAKK